MSILSHSNGLPVNFGGGSSGVQSFNSRVGAVDLNQSDILSVNPVINIIDQDIPNSLINTSGVSFPAFNYAKASLYHINGMAHCTVVLDYISDFFTLHEISIDLSTLFPNLPHADTTLPWGASGSAFLQSTTHGVQFDCAVAGMYYNNHKYQFIISNVEISKIFNSLQASLIVASVQWSAR